MRYQMPNFPCEFEIPDAWLAEAGIQGFAPSAPAFRSSADAVLIPLAQIEPPVRFAAYPKDWRGFSRERMVRILKWFVTGAEIEAVPLLRVSSADEITPPQFQYRVRDGYHRFYASVAGGFERLPGAF
jgi:hypothetical protein